MSQRVDAASRLVRRDPFDETCCSSAVLIPLPDSPESSDHWAMCGSCGRKWFLDDWVDPPSWVRIEYAYCTSQAAMDACCRDPSSCWSCRDAEFEGYPK